MVVCGYLCVPRCWHYDVGLWYYVCDRYEQVALYGRGLAFS